MEILARHAAEGSSAHKAVRQGAVLPSRSPVHAPASSARSVAAPVVIETGNQVIGRVRILRNGGLVLRLGAALEAAIAHVETVLIDLDIRAPRHGTLPAGIG